MLLLLPFDAAHYHCMQALLAMNMTRKRVLVFGSTSPKYEALCLALGAAHVTTVEYNQLTYEHDRITTLTAAEFAGRQQDLAGMFDVALSISRPVGVSRLLLLRFDAAVLLLLPAALITMG